VALTQAEIQADMAPQWGGTPPPPDTTAPTAAHRTWRTAASATQINLSWTASTDNVGVNGLRVERCQGAGCTTFAQIAAPTPRASTTPGSAQARATAIAYAPPTPQAISARTRILLQPRPGRSGHHRAHGTHGVERIGWKPSQINLSWTASTDNVGVHRVSE